MFINLFKYAVKHLWLFWRLRNGTHTGWQVCKTTTKISEKMKAMGFIRRVPADSRIFKPAKLRITFFLRKNNDLERTQNV